MNQNGTNMILNCNIQENDTEMKSMKVNAAAIQSSILESLEGIEN